MLEKIKMFLMEIRDYYVTGVFRVLKRLDKLKGKQEKLFLNLELSLKHDKNELLNSIKHTQNTLAQSLNAQNKKLAIYHITSQFLDENLHTHLNQKQVNINKNKFLLFDYSTHSLLYDAYNLGDYMQTIATKTALNQIFDKLQFDYFDRDTLSFYQSLNDAKTPCVMQGWFAYGYDFWPSRDILPIFVGTHFTPGTHRFLLELLVHFPKFFQNIEIGCRDKFTLDFCQNYKIKSYFSRCLTLTLPKRKPLKGPGKVFFVDVPKPFLNFIPQELKQNAEFVSQGLCLAPKTHWQHYHDAMQTLLKRYENEASLIITNRIHCASPCTALGIPVIFIKNNEEQSQRFSALDGILKPYTLNDFKENKIDFNPKAPDIESLKDAMLENLKLSIAKAFGEKIDEQRLLNTREKIANFECL